MCNYIISELDSRMKEKNGAVLVFLPGHLHRKLINWV
jgi:HrpA-like RNA helicase